MIISSFNPSPFLTREQSSFCEQLDSRIQKIIFHHLLPGNMEEFTQAWMIIEVFERSRPDQYEAITSLFLRVFDEPEKKKAIEKIHQLQSQSRLNECLTYSAPGFLTNRGRPEENIDRSILKITGSQTWIEAPSAADWEEFAVEIEELRKEYSNDLSSAISGLIKTEEMFLEGLWVVKRLRFLLGNNLFPFKAVNDFVRQKSSWQNLVTILRSEAKYDPDKKSTQETLTSLMQRFTSMPFPLPPASLNQIKVQFTRLQELKVDYHDKSMGHLVAAAKVLRANKCTTEEERLSALALVIRAVELHFQINLHPTQILTVLAQLLFSEGCLAQVKTGEGKSMIVTLLIFLLAMEGKTVHIISSSANLAERDQRKFEKFFALFDISTANICKTNLEKKDFQAPILYGAASNFEFAIMQEMLCFESLFPQEASSLETIKRFDVVIVDEVDNLTIDTLLHGARLSFPAENSHDWVYALIMQFVEQSKKGNISQLRQFLAGHSKTSFSDQQLELWLQLALRAKYELDENHHYVVQCTPTGKKIKIVDADNTGRIMHDSRWSKGLHEFVEAKHSLPVEKETLSPLSISHPVYYEMYRSIYGLSGTLGSKSEREEIHAIYHIASFDVPLYLPLQRKDHPPIIVSSQQKVLDLTLQKIKECRQAGRPILVLCKTIEFSLEVGALLSSHGIPHALLNEVQKASEELVLTQAGVAGAVTIATNTAGRGTDIQLTQQSLANGGLHTLLTFFSDSLRVDEQGRGRAGRLGQPGSSEVICASNLPLSDLLQKRELHTELVKELHIYLSKIDRYRFKTSRDFFIRITAFRKALGYQKSFLSGIWAPRVLTNPPPALDKLPIKDAQIANEVFSLLTNRERQENRWKGLIETIHKRVQTLLIQNWSLHFQIAVDDLINDSKIEQLLTYKFALNHLDSKSAEEFATVVEERYEDLIGKMKALFTKKLSVWDKYLTPDGAGIEQYLELIIKGSPLIFS